MMYGALSGKRVSYFPFTVLFSLFYSPIQKIYVFSSFDSGSVLSTQTLACITSERKPMGKARDDTNFFFTSHVSPTFSPCTLYRSRMDKSFTVVLGHHYTPHRVGRSVGQALSVFFLN